MDFWQMVNAIHKQDIWQDIIYLYVTYTVLFCPLGKHAFSSEFLLCITQVRLA